MTNNIYDYSYQMRRNLQKKIGFIFIFLLVIFILVAITSSFFIFLKFIKSDSMSPTLEKNNIVFISPFASPSNPIFSDKKGRTTLERLDQTQYTCVSSCCQPFFASFVHRRPACRLTRRPAR